MCCSLWTERRSRRRLEDGAGGLNGSIGSKATYRGVPNARNVLVAKRKNASGDVCETPTRYCCCSCSLSVVPSMLGLWAGFSEGRDAVRIFEGTSSRSSLCLLKRALQNQGFGATNMTMQCPIFFICWSLRLFEKS